jgi:hypothetical protein
MGEFGPARAHETREAHDLALPELEVDPLEDPPGVSRVEGLPVPDLEDDLVRGLRGPLRVDVVYLAPYHVLDHGRLGDLPLARVEGADRLPVPEDGHRVRDLDDLLELVGDHDAGHALGLELPQYPEEIVAVVLVEGRGGLVEDQYAHVAGEGLGYLDELLLADAEVFNPHGRVDVQPHPLEHLAGLHDRLVLVHEALRADLVAEEDVLVDRHLGHQGELLVDDGDAGLLAVRDGAEGLGLPVYDDVA